VLPSNISANHFSTGSRLTSTSFLQQYEQNRVGQWQAFAQLPGKIREQYDFRIKGVKVFAVMKSQGYQDLCNPVSEEHLLHGGSAMSTLSCKLRWRLYSLSERMLLFRLSTHFFLSYIFSGRAV